MDEFALLDGFLGMAIATRGPGDDSPRREPLAHRGVLRSRPDRSDRRHAGNLTVFPDLESANKTIRGVYSLVVIAIAIVAAKRLKIQ